jgi:N-acetylmuramoyl-L-alanine amidase
MNRTEFGKLLNLEEDLIPEGKKNRPGTSNSLKYITIHNTDNSDHGADARAHAKFVKNTGYYTNAHGEKIWVSWHYTVDDTRVIKHLPLNEGCYHTFNGGNQQSIAIEICMNEGINQEAAFLRAARLVAALLYDLKKSADSIVPHYFWTKKNCPRLLLNDGEPGTKWKNFISMIKAEHASIDQPA